VTDHDRIRLVYRNYERDGRAGLWDMANPGYARMVHERDRAIRALLEASIEGDAARILDVGCGDGRLAKTVRLISTTAQYHGIDLLPERIVSARRNVPEGAFEVASVDRLPYADAMFDVVVAMTLFSSLPTALEIAGAHEIARVTRPDGWLIWFDLRYHNPSNPAVHGVTQRRLSDLFPGWDRELRSFTLIPPVARRLGPLTPPLYPLLHAIAPLRSHLIGRLRCPT
jgi:ubiquinone/menaquinone biosynthesis C-methylase UbiE